jgi:hypothetical protein
VVHRREERRVHCLQLVRTVRSLHERKVLKKVFKSEKEGKEAGKNIVLCGMQTGGDTRHEDRKAGDQAGR